MNNTSTAALETLRAMTTEGVRCKDDSYKRISKSFLETKGVAALRDNGELQALVLQIYKR